MRKIYITACPINFRLDREKNAEGKMAEAAPAVRDLSDALFGDKVNEQATYFPIVSVLINTMEKDDEAKIIVVRQFSESENARENTAANMNCLLADLTAAGVANASKQLAADEITESPIEIASGMENITIRDLPIAEEQTSESLLSILRGLNDAAEDDADYYADMTFGTKTFPLVLMTALNMADKVKKDTEISGLYYNEKKWTLPGHPNKLYNMKILFDLNNILDMAGNTENAQQMLGYLFR